MRLTNIVPYTTQSLAIAVVVTQLYSGQDACQFNRKYLKYQAPFQEPFVNQMVITDYIHNRTRTLFLVFQNKTPAGTSPPENADNQPAPLFPFLPPPYQYPVSLPAQQHLSLIHILVWRSLSRSRHIRSAIPMRCICCMPVYRWRSCRVWWGISPSAQRRSTRRCLHWMWLHGTGCSFRCLSPMRCLCSKEFLKLWLF